MGKSTATMLQAFFDAMLARFGPQEWWPGESPFEVMVGAVLTQNTSWSNVEKAIARLKAAGALSPRAIDAMDPAELAELIRPAGYFNVKARRLKNLVAWMVAEFGGSVARMRKVDAGEMRRRLLEVKGVGRETADSILLYALDHARFVVDAYTFRVAARHGLVAPPADYDELQALFEDHLPHDADLFNEYHALLVAVGKTHCRPTARCDDCPLASFPHDESAV